MNDNPNLQPLGKSIDIVDQTPEAEDLINAEPIEANQPEPEAPAEPEYHEEPKTYDEPKSHEEPKGEINIDPERACEVENQEFFDIMREKLSNLRRERNECIVQIDKKQDEITIIERRNLQYEVAGTPEKVERGHIEQLEAEISDIREQVAAKDRIIHGVLRTLRTL